MAIIKKPSSWKNASMNKRFLVIVAGKKQQTTARKRNNATCQNFPCKRTELNFNLKRKRKEEHS